MILIDSLFNFPLEFSAEFLNLYLVLQHSFQYCVSVIQSDCIEKLLLVFISKRKVNTQLINQTLRIVNLQNLCRQIFTDSSALHTVKMEFLFDIAQNCLFDILILNVFFLKNPDLPFQIRILSLQPQQFAPA